MENKKNLNLKVLFLLESSVCGRFCMCSGPMQAAVERAGLQPHTNQPLTDQNLWSICGSTAYSYIRPYLLSWSQYHSELHHRPLEMVWAEKHVATAASTQHILSIHSKCRNPLLNDILRCLFIFLAFERLCCPAHSGLGLHMLTVT